MKEGSRRGAETQSSDLRVFRMNDSDWWAAESLEEAKRDYVGLTQCESDHVEDARALTALELDTLFYWRGESRNVVAFEYWECACGAKADADCRWDGERYHHPHAYPMGHVPMDFIGRVTFRERLAELHVHDLRSQFFATTEC